MTATMIDGEAIERQVLAGLKSFQRATVDYVFQRMYTDPDPATRFLVADEVGLGKTLVARGLIARVIKYHQAIGTERIDIVYICSNADIATQNVRRLNVTGDQDFSLATRITLLPLQLNKLTRNGVNFVSFTPGTSFNMVSRSGTGEERAVIFRLLEYALGESLDHGGAYRALRSGMYDHHFRSLVNNRMPRVATNGGDGLDPGLANAFRVELSKRPELIARFRQLLLNDGEPDDADWHERERVIGELRQTLARSCVEALEPDLVILDEFQRFRDLLQEPDPDSPEDIRHLAHHLFDQAGSRTLLLSATPYKMYTLRDEEHDDHYADFLKTSRFLMGDNEAQALEDDLRAFRHALTNFRTAGEKAVLSRKRRIERRLRRYISRTERLMLAGNRSGMLVEHELSGTRLAADDLRSYAMVDRLSRKLSTGDVTDYWKSSPFLLNFMGDYRLKHKLRLASTDPEVSREVDPAALLKREQLEAYEAHDLGNARLRGLAADTVDTGAWRLLWLPPSLPYYRGRGAYADPRTASFTKRLIFSSWNVVPDAVSVMLSYEAERQMMLSRDPSARNSAEDRARLRGLLSIRLRDDEPAAMSTFSLLYPCVTLAQLTDPLDIARHLGAPEVEVDLAEIRAEATRRLEPELARVTRRAPTEGPVDQRWYWAAPLLLDRQRRTHDATNDWLATSQALRSPGAATDGHDDESKAWLRHIEFAQAVLDGELRLGRVPPDLAESTALLGLGGPATCALRAIARVLAAITGRRPDYLNHAARDAAVRIGWGFRTLFNVPEVMALLRGPTTQVDDIYWRRAAEEGLNGNLQAVLDEYIHLLPQWLGLLDQDPDQVAWHVGHTVHDAVSVRAANYRPDNVQVTDDGLTFSPLPMRGRFALRFGRDVTDDQQTLHRSSVVRAAFNSPFWPFVLTSTSVGQEGLDFHQYCHAVVHWNLPANPVDLEQREGRVHRYKGHAIRKNVAERHRAAAFGRRVTDPWAAMFADAVRASRHGALRDMEPFWVYEGSAHIERHVPLLPLSREVQQLARLRRSLAAYRLVFGQPRQEDLIEYLRDRIEPADLNRLVEQLSIDLRPR